ncbi:hypothetical protein ACFVAJ_18690 [Agromyces sp. NPDC057679]|uniref:hypothetical protein n=1 Tax=Agromyces sp. NPDC057679 TaxID=3346207 RepID=UPI003671A08F
MTNTNNGHDGWKNQARRTDGEFGEKLQTPADVSIASHNNQFKFAKGSGPVVASSPMQLARGMLCASEITADDGRGKVTWNEIDFIAMAAEANYANRDTDVQRTLRWLLENRSVIDEFLTSKNITMTGDEWDNQTFTVTFPVTETEPAALAREIVASDEADYVYNALDGSGEFSVDLLRWVNGNGVRWDGVYSTRRWEEEFEPATNEHGDMVRYELLSEIPAGTPAENVWTLHHDDGDDEFEDYDGDGSDIEWMITAGYGRVNVAGYYITKNPWSPGNQPDVSY